MLYQDAKQTRDSKCEAGIGSVCRACRSLPIVTEVTDACFSLSFRAILTDVASSGHTMGKFQVLIFFFLVTWLGCGSALAEKRVALVIGNSTYQKVAKLSNPANDAEAITNMLKSAGFDSVESKLNLSVSEMRKALRDFGNKSRDADIAVVYYAGHGIELDGTNYLIPIDATLETDADVFDETLPLDRVLFAVEPAKQLRLVILDACRDNPFAKTMKRTIASRAIGRGLAKVEPTSPNTMIAFAAKAGSTVSDGDSKNSPFAAALIEHLPKPGLDLRRAFGFVRDDVLKNTGNKQEPYIYGSLGGNDVPLVRAKPVATGPQPNPQDAVRKDYELALQLGTREGWEAFLSQYPDGFYANLAKGQLRKIAAEEARAAAAEKARIAEQENARLAEEGARQAEQAKAAAAAKAAEEARLAAEKAKQIEIEKAAAAEQARAAAEKVAAEKAEANQKPKDDKVAALTAPAVDPDQQTSLDVPRALQSELRRVGCITGTVDGNWNAASQRALDLFNKHAGMKLDVKVASVDALDAVKARSGRVCPLVCDRDFRADGDRCVKITCRAGYRINDDSQCEKIQEKKPVAIREGAKPKREADRKQIEAAPSKPQASGQIFCDNQGCRPVAKGCRIETPRIAGMKSYTQQYQVCN